MKKRPSINLDEMKEDIAILEDDNGEGEERDMDQNLDYLSVIKIFHM